MSDDYGDDGGGVVDETAFFKALQSDVADDVSLNLLMEVYDTNDMWADFQEEEIQQVVETFSILNMAPGEKLITKGEFATFCGIVLQGTFHAVVTPTFTVPLRLGDMIGEMALFEGGARNADIITGTDPEGCILAVITYVDLDNLAMNERYSQLARKLTTMFATASIKKLRGMLKPPPAATTAAPTDGSAPPAAGATTPTATDGAVAPAATPAAATPASPVVTPAAAAVVPATTDVAALPTATATNVTAEAAPEVKKKLRGQAKKAEAKKAVVAETLYKNKMAAKPAAAAATAPPPTAVQASTTDASTVPQAKNLGEAQKLLEEQQLRLKKAEHSKRNQQVMLDKLNKQIKGHEETLKGQEEQIGKLTSELKTATDSLKDLTGKHSTQTKLLEETTAGLEKEKKGRIEMESKMTLSQADLASKNGEELSRLKLELEKITQEKSQLEITLAGEKATLSALMLAKESESSRSTQKESELKESLEKLTKDFATTKQRSDQLDADLKSALKSLDDSRIQHSSQNMRILDLEEKLSAAMSWKLKALEFQSGLDAEKKRHIRLSDDWTKQSKELEQELKHYKLLLKTFTITIYAKEFRLRKLIGNLHKRVSEMLLTTLEEHYNTASGKEKGLVASNTNGGTIGGGKGSGMSGASNSINTTFKSVRKRKKVYLDNLLKPTSKLRDVVSSLDDEVSKLKGPFEEIRERCLHWRATSESFFQRNIDLASKLMTLDKSLLETSQQKDAALINIKQQSRDLERLTQKHADLNAKFAGGVGGAQPTHGIQGGGGAHGGSADTKESKAHARAELDMLEARATVLRVHVQQLEGHYLQLQQAIHNATSGGAAAAQSQQQLQQPHHFQESKHQGDFHSDRYDPALVSPVPFPAYQGMPMSGAGGGVMMSPGSASNAQFHGQQQPLVSPRGAITLAPRGGAPVLYQPPSGGGAYGGQRGWQGSGPPLSPQGHKPDVISLRQLREQQGAAGVKQQQQPVLPAVAGAHPHPHQQPVPFQSYPVPPPQSHPMTIATPQRTQLSFSPRTTGQQ